jgi:hypothetical protein
MTPADVYGAVYDAAPALRLWLPVNRPVFDAAVRRAGDDAAEEAPRTNDDAEATASALGE